MIFFSSPLERLPQVLLIAFLLSPRLSAAEPYLVLPVGVGETTIRLGVVVTVDGQPPEKAHEAFLDRLFDFYDRDGDGRLSKEEAARIFPLPLPGSKSIAMDFTRLDADANGQGSRAEFKQFYARAGFTAVVAVFPPSNADMQKASTILFNRLDRNGDGRLDADELAQAPALMRVFDADEDEVLTIDEILAATPNPAAPSTADAPIRWEVAKDAQQPDGVWVIGLGKPNHKLELRSVMGKAFETQTEDARRLRYADGVIALGPLDAGPASRFSSSREFYVAPLKSALGDKPFLEQKEIEDDPALAFLAGVFAHADRNGDNRLTPAELEAFLDLIEAGLRAQIVITVRDQGKNLFLLLDENQDGRLDLRELTRAARLIPKQSKFLARSDIPRQVVVSIEQGLSAKTFGPLVLSGATKPPAAAKTVGKRGPKWFQAMDRNGDGFLSPGEFLGPPEVFAAIDADGDGFISAAEAERAEVKGKKR